MPNELNLDSITITGTAESVARPGSVKLDGYSLLAYAPEQYPGRGIVTEDNGTSVADIITAYAMKPSAEAIAAQFATGVPHVLDAIRYAIATGYAQATTPAEKD